MITLGIVQATSAGSLENRLAEIAQYAFKAKSCGCAAVCFPECSLSGYSPESAAEKALPADHPAMQRLSCIARKLRIDLLVGFMERDLEHFYATHGVFRSDGRTFFYRKTHLGLRERLVFAPGDRLEVYMLSCGLPIGFQLCVETHFPEITQTLSLRGAQVIFAPHAVPMTAQKRQSLWEKIIPARSYDNRVYMACCNAWDADRYGGGCLVTGPEGTIVASCWDNRPALLTFAVNAQTLEQYRARTTPAHFCYYPGERRPELYFDPRAERKTGVQSGQ